MQYRIMQVGRASFYVECFERNLFGLFPKWRPVKSMAGAFGTALTKYWPSLHEAQDWVNSQIEFRDGPKEVLFIAPEGGFPA